MSTDRETTLAVRSWLEDGATRLPDRVLDAVLDQLPATPQRRSWWPARRFADMNTYVKLFAAAAAVLVVAVVGYQLLPRNGGVGGQPTIAPSPTPSLLAHGTFTVAGFSVELDATGGGSSVTGRMAVDSPTGDFTVDLQCARTSATGLLSIGGDVTASTDNTYAPKGTRTGIVIKRGSPAQAIFVFQMEDPPSASCLAFFDDMARAIGGEPTEFGLVAGTLQLAP